MTGRDAHDVEFTSLEGGVMAAVIGQPELFPSVNQIPPTGLTTQKEQAMDLLEGFSRKEEPNEEAQTEFKPGDIVTFKPYETAIKAKVQEMVPSCQVTHTPDDDRVFYRLTGVDPKKGLMTVTTGATILESKHYNREEE